jgi:hypothetical protein
MEVFPGVKKKKNAPSHGLVSFSKSTDPRTPYIGARDGRTAQRGQKKSILSLYRIDSS